MKYLFSLIMLVLVLVGCSATPKTPAEVRVFRDVAVTFHADSDFNEAGRAHILAAADRLRKFTSDRARITVVFDLDFNSTSNLEEHLRNHDSLLVGALSGDAIAEAIDARHDGVVLAETAGMRDGSFRVAFIMDRIRIDQVDSVITHEFGHVAGMEDLPVMGSIMSGFSSPTVPEPKNFTASDLAECRRVQLCD